MPSKLWLASTFTLGIAAAGFHILGALALQDIFHHEPDVRLEVWVVRISFLLTALFIAAALRTVMIVRRSART